MIRDVRPPETETTGIQIEIPPWAESYEISATDMDGKSLLYIVSVTIALINSRQPTACRGDRGR